MGQCIPSESGTRAASAHGQSPVYTILLHTRRGSACTGPSSEISFGYNLARGSVEIPDVVPHSHRHRPARRDERECQRVFFCYRGRPSALLDPAAVVADPRRDYNRAFVLRFAKKNSPWPSAERSRLAQAARGGRERGARGPRPRAPARRARRVLLSSRIAFIISLHT